jgi:hypothetical protein
MLGPPVSAFLWCRSLFGVSTFQAPEPFLVSAFFLCLMLFFVETAYEDEGPSLRAYVDWRAAR